MGARWLSLCSSFLWSLNRSGFEVIKTMVYSLNPTDSLPERRFYAQR